MIIAVIINNVKLLIVLVIISVERLINKSSRVLVIVFIIILPIVIFNNINRAFDVHGVIVIRMLPGHLALGGFTFIK